MMRLFTLFILVIASMLIGVQLHNDPGYVLIAINHWTIETTLWLAIFALLLLFLVSYFVIQILGKLNHSPASLKQWRDQRKIIKANQQTRLGLIQFSEGYFEKATVHLQKALSNTDSPLINYLTLARAAQEMGDSTRRDQYLREAQRTTPDAQIAIGLTQAQLQLKHHQWEQALATLRHLQDLAPRHPYVLKQLMHLYQEVKDWQALLDLLPTLAKTGVISREKRNQLESETYLQILQDLCRHDNLIAVKTYIARIPKHIRQEPVIILCLVDALTQQLQNSEAESLLQMHLKHQYNEALFIRYGELATHEHALSFAEQLLKKASPTAKEHLTLARLCMQQQLWGKAKDYLEKSLSQLPTADAYAKLGELCEILGDPDGAQDAFKKGLMLSTL